MGAQVYKREACGVAAALLELCSGMWLQASALCLVACAASCTCPATHPAASSCCVCVLQLYPLLRHSFPNHSYCVTSTLLPFPQSPYRLLLTSWKRSKDYVAMAGEVEKRQGVQVGVKEANTTVKTYRMWL